MVDSPDVRILPGVPDIGERGADSYPDSTSDVIKLLRQSGVTVQYLEGDPARRQRLELLSDHIYLSVMLLHAMGPLGISMTANVLTDVLKHLVKLRPNSTMHLKAGHQHASGEIKWLEVSGDGAHIVEAVKSFFADESNNDESG